MDPKLWGPHMWKTIHSMNQNMLTSTYEEQNFSTCSYRFHLLRMMQETNGYCLQNRNSNQWLDLISKVTKRDLTDAHCISRNVFQSLFAHVKLLFSPRPIVSLHCVQEKALHDPFKANLDLSSFRVCCNPEQISHAFKIIEQVVTSQGGFCALKNFIEDENGNLTDIVACCHVYLPSIGYITEIQIGHPFFFYATFSNGEIQSHENCYKIDMWTMLYNEKKCIYDQVKSVLLSSLSEKEKYIQSKSIVEKLFATLHLSIPSDCICALM